MTTRGRIGDDGQDERERVVISSPEEMIASVPAMLGFPPPPGSVVLVGGRMSDGGNAPVMRVDVPGLQDEDTIAPTEGELFGEPGLDAPDGESGLVGGIDPGPAQSLAEFCAREGVRSVHLIVVREDCIDGHLAAQRAMDAAAAFDYWLGLAGTEVVNAFGVEEFAAGAPWVDLFGMVRGIQLDPDATHLAAVYAFQGRSVAASRSDIDRLYLTRDPDARDSDGGDTDAAAMAETSELVARHDSAAACLGTGERVDDDELAVIGRGLLSIDVRDEVYRNLAQRTLTDDDGRRLLWWALARRRPPKERSVALLLLGAAAYFAGSGVHANAALSAAVTADGTNSLARLMLNGLIEGIAPERLRQVAAA